MKRTNTPNVGGTRIQRNFSPVNVIILSLVSLAIVGCTLSDKNYEFGHDMDMYPSGVYNEKYKDYGENPFVNTTDEPISTFSVDADGGSYTNMRRFMHLGQLPPVESVRIEEYLNFFTYDYKEPEKDENVSLESEIATCPWNDAHHLIRIGMKGITIPAEQLPNSNYVFLIDVSGSMASPDKLGVLKTGFTTLADNLRDKDRIAIVTYAGSAGVLLESTNGSEKAKIKTAIKRLDAGGSTAGAEGIVTAYKIAEKNFIKDGNNRIILGTDGDFNVGISSTDELVKLIEEKRESGVYLTVLGVGDGNLNDQMMEQIANKGNGNYEYIDRASQIQKVFTEEITKFYTVAKDCKIQVTFSPTKVSSYRLIGYENRKLNTEDFENDSTDAGEIGAGQTITALYEVTLTPDLSAAPHLQPYAQFDFRYKKPHETESRLLEHKIMLLPKDMNDASENTRFAASVAGFALMMKNSEYRGTLSKGMVIDLAKGALSFDPNGYRSEYVDLLKSR
ncbi:MAG: vWA domain-containing protein [Paludibacteraceae bacterium]